MRIERASAKAVRYAIMTWHYSKSVPLVQIAYSVFNDADEWCGVICYSIGANNSISKPYNLAQGQVIELVRVALNGKQECTSKAVAMSLRAIKKDAPLVRLIVSYADTGQGHVGTIYQATNWIFAGSTTPARCYLVNGVKVHERTIQSKGVKQNIDAVRKSLDANAIIIYDEPKHKYLYPLTKDMKKLCETLRKPYPKKHQNL